MFVNLEHLETRVLVSEYINQIVNYSNIHELNQNVHKLIHTFEVVKAAEELLQNVILDDETKKMIINAAILHDIGRCHQFTDGIYDSTINHAYLGAELLQKLLPNHAQEIEIVRWHSDLPSAQDPQSVSLALGYVRDADIIANLRYEIKHFDIFIEHYKDCFGDEVSIDNEVVSAAKERRAAVLDRFVLSTSGLSSMVMQLLWCFILQTDAAKKIAAEQQLFIKFRDILVQKALPAFLDKKYVDDLTNQIVTLFPDNYFTERIFDDV